MQQRLLHTLSVLFIVLLGFSIFYSCANMASPTGGLYDVRPPVPRTATPSFNSLNVGRKKIVIDFDEYIKLEKPSEKIIITPPQSLQPHITATGKRVEVELLDDLLPNTTYTIDFTDAIVDNNEGNPLENFSYAFSTGDELDTLAVSGTVLNANNLEPVSGILVGVHSDVRNEVFVENRFERAGRTDSRGKFSIKGLKAGKYRIYALKDKNTDFKFDNPQEEIAFSDSIVIPSTMPATRQDTVFNAKDTTKIDTVKTIHYTRFMPDDIVLRSFINSRQKKYLQRHARPEQKKIELKFYTQTPAPELRLIQPKRDNSQWYVKESSPQNDSIVLWMTDSLIYNQDTLKMEVKYLKTDSLFHDILTTDTLNFTFKKPKESRRRSDRDKEPEVKFLSISHNIKSQHELFEPITLEFGEPIVAFDTAKIHFTYTKEKDTIGQAVKYRWEQDKANLRLYTLRPRWEPGGKYVFSIDSASFTNIYGDVNNKVNVNFSTKFLEQYGNLLLTVTGVPDKQKAYVELLDKSDKPLRMAPVIDQVAKFQDLTPGTLYARLFIDTNDDGKWTSGNFYDNQQPEMVYYRPQPLEIRVFTDHEESWDILQTPAIKQKPLEITKNKPEEKKRVDRNAELLRNRENQNNNRNNNNTMTNPFGGGGMRPTR